MINQCSTYALCTQNVYASSHRASLLSLMLTLMYRLLAYAYPVKRLSAYGSHSLQVSFIGVNIHFLRIVTSIVSRLFWIVNNNFTKNRIFRFSESVVEQGVFAFNRGDFVVFGLIFEQIPIDFLGFWVAFCCSIYQR